MVLLPGGDEIFIVWKIFWRNLNDGDLDIYSLEDLSITSNSNEWNKAPIAVTYFQVNKDRKIVHS